MNQFRTNELVKQEQDWKILQLTSYLTQPAAIRDLTGSTRCLRGRGTNTENTSPDHCRWRRCQLW
jgi:hypothetical protein